MKSTISRPESKNEKKIGKIINKYQGEIAKICHAMEKEMMLIENSTEGDWAIFFYRAEITFNYQISRLKKYIWDYPRSYKVWLGKNKLWTRKNKKVKK
jgi:hypothetical protein